MFLLPQLRLHKKLSELKEQNKESSDWIALMHLRSTTGSCESEDNYYYLEHTFSHGENKAGLSYGCR